MDDLAKQSSKISIHSNARILEHHTKGYMQTAMCHLSKQFVLCSLFKTVAKWVYVLKYCKEQVGPTSSKKWSMHTWCYYLDLSGIVFPFIIITSSLPPSSAREYISCLFAKKMSLYNVFRVIYELKSQTEALNNQTQIHAAISFNQLSTFMIHLWIMFLCMYNYKVEQMVKA